MGIFGTSSNTDHKQSTLISEIQPPQNLMVLHKDLKSEEFDIAIIKWVNDSRPELNYLQVKLEMKVLSILHFD